MNELTGTTAPSTGTSSSPVVLKDDSPHADGGFSPASTVLSLLQWLVAGFRASVFLKPKVAAHSPTPWQVLLIAVTVLAIDAAASRFQVVGPAVFNVQIWLGGWWVLGLMVAFAWWTLDASSRTLNRQLGGVASFITLWLIASVIPGVLTQILGGAVVRGWFSGWWSSTSWGAWALYLSMLAWSLAVSAVLLWRYAGLTAKVAAFALLLVAVSALGAWKFDQASWSPDYAANDASEVKQPRLKLSQDVFEAQQALLYRQIAGLAPQRPGVTDVYGLVFAPYAEEDVFLRESTLASEVLSSHLDADGRVLHLLNHASTASTRPWATTLNLQRAIAGIAQRMDRDKDVLVIYMTSHGASDFRLSASHWPLEVDELTPAVLREALDAAGIRHRVIAISACFSGGWVDPLANDDTLVMTAADATHTSYGCGKLSPLTFFGRALFDEQLRKTHSFEKAFAAAVPIIRRREIDAGKADGFSNPQIRVGKGIAPVLQALEQRLDALPMPVAPALPASASAPLVPVVPSLASALTSASKTPPLMGPRGLCVGLAGDPLFPGRQHVNGSTAPA